jgi:hypothetical protein
MSFIVGRLRIVTKIRKKGNAEYPLGDLTPCPSPCPSRGGVKSIVNNNKKQ